MGEWLHAMVDLAGLLAACAGCAFAGYWKGRRIEQEFWSKLMTDDPKAMFISARRTRKASNG